MDFGELLGMLLNRLGFDFSSMSRPRLIFAVAVYSLLIILLVCGGFIILHESDTIVSAIIGIVVLLFGLLMLVRIVLNLLARFRKPAGTI
jgi:hypothetical protein